MSKISDRHHYIPIFLLKEFTNEHGKLWVYNKERDLIERKSKSPKAIFFEPGRNTTTLGDNKYDWIEKIYSNLDDSIAKVHQRIIGINEQVKDEKERVNLALDIIVLVNFIRWRVPARDKIVYEIYDNYNIGELSLQTIHKKTNEVIKNKEFNEFLKGLDVFRKMQSTAIIWEPWYDSEHIKSVSEKIRLVSGTEIPTLICDNPFIEQSISEDVKKIPEFFFPLSKDKMAYYLADSSLYEIDSHASYLIELAKFEVSRKYVACENKEILECFVSEYQAKRSNKLSFANELFEYVSKK